MGPHDAPNRHEAMNVTYCWSLPSGYLAACMAELASRPGIDVTLVMFEPDASAPFDIRLFRGVETRVLSRGQRGDPASVASVVTASGPDVVVFAGWSHRPYVQLLDHRPLSGAKFVMSADTAIRFDWRQRLAPLRIGSLLRRVDAVLVPGDRGSLVMRSWGVASRKIARLLYAIDYAGFASAGAVRSVGRSWPRRFLFAGRYVHEKALDVLVDGYRAYRDRATNPWPLITCGTGPLAHLLRGTAGIEDRGFRQPSDLMADFADAGAFVLPSRVEPWGQVIVEAAASGLPVICSDRCGAGPEVIKDFHGGFVVPSEDPLAIRDAMLWMHDHPERLAEMGASAQHVASAYSTQRWADNQLALFRRLHAAEVG